MYLGGDRDAHATMRISLPRHSLQTPTPLGSQFCPALRRAACPGTLNRACPPRNPSIEGLHDALAHAIVKKNGQLAPQEIVFRRKSLGWSGVDFAKHMGCDKAQISKWEHGTVKMSKPYELLLREIVASGKVAPAGAEPSFLTGYITAKK